jgi:hypothetical protein
MVGSVISRLTRLLAVALTLSLAACSDDEPDNEGRIKVDCSETSAATVENFARAPIPKGATSLEVFCSGFTDTLVRARIVMPRRDLRRFLRDAGFSAPPRRGVRPFTERADDPPTWQIKRIEHVLGHEEDCLAVKTKACASGLAGRKIVVDLDTPNRAIVYLQAFTS